MKATVMGSLSQNSEGEEGGGVIIGGAEANAECAKAEGGGGPFRHGGLA